MTGGLVVRRLATDPAAIGGFGVMAVLVLFAFGRWRLGDLGPLREPPSRAHWFGTTGTGRDVFALTMRGMRKSLVIGLAVAILATGLAACAGAFAGYLGGWTDRILMGTADVLLVLPAVLLVAVVAPRGGSWLLIAGILAAFMWTVTARAVRAQTRSLKEKEFVLAAVFLGASTPRIVFRHILPNLAGLLIADATLNVSFAILAESGLAFLGFGVHDTSLGTLIEIGRAHV